MIGHESSEVGRVGRVAVVQGPADVMDFRMAIVGVSANDPLEISRARQDVVPSRKRWFEKKPVQCIAAELPDVEAARR